MTNKKPKCGWCKGMFTPEPGTQHQRCCSIECEYALQVLEHTPDKDSLKGGNLYETDKVSS
ncbi:hypothetical protein LCGC14_0146360 [marine sediment metagenome]|uniref:Uncharacterized protein n=1 Tax=marine sediment metagenome TaxID=412755 RepID=A0A0F9UZY3_9ZZZZ